MKKVKNNLRPPRRSLARVRKLVPTPAQAGAWLALFAFFFVTIAALTGRDRLVTGEEAEVAAPADPTYLSPEDRGLYAMIDRAQEAGNFSKADAYIHRLSNRGLVGYTLAERYLNSGYQARAEELRTWLTHYADHPQAPRIAALAEARGVRTALPKRIELLRGYGFSDHLGRSGMPDSWFTALSDWREGDFSGAASRFEKLGADASLNDWQRSAAHFWAARTQEKLGNEDTADAHLKRAAAYETTFYGLLAARQLGRVSLAVEVPEVSDSVRESPRAMRASLLAQLDRKEEAEIELRALYVSVAQHKRAGIVTLASELNLPNLQIRLARTTGLTKAEAHFAKFPMPHYMVELHPLMDSALLMAVARNESGFRETARNGSSGAMGMMQMLPSTAQTVERRVGASLMTAELTDLGSVHARLSNPALAARYGAEYLKLLTREKHIGSNLIHLLIGYNAGPGTASSWQRVGGHVTDPLLYIESIPYGETRNYVMQVLAQYWTYQLMMDETPESLKALSNGQWPMLKSDNS